MVENQGGWSTVGKASSVQSVSHEHAVLDVTFVEQLVPAVQNHILTESLSSWSQKRRQILFPLPHRKQYLRLQRRLQAATLRPRLPMSSLKRPLCSNTSCLKARRRVIWQGRNSCIRKIEGDMNSMELVNGLVSKTTFYRCTRIDEWPTIGNPRLVGAVQKQCNLVPNLSNRKMAELIKQQYAIPDAQRRLV
jgi:hypothetical protein